MAISKVKEVAAPTATSSTTLTFAVPSGGVAIGDLLVAEIVTANNACVVSSVTDAKSTWNFGATNGIQIAPGSGNGYSLLVCWAIAGASYSSGDTIVFNLSIATNSEGVMTEWSGIAASPLDQKNTKGDTFTSSYTSNSITTTQASELLIGVVAILSTGHTVTPAAGWTKEKDVATTRQMVLLSQIVSAAGAYAASGSFETSVNAEAAIISFKAAAATFVPQILAFG